MKSVQHFGAIVPTEKAKQRVHLLLDGAGWVALDGVAATLRRLIGLAVAAGDGSGIRCSVPNTCLSFMGSRDTDAGLLGYLSN